MVANARVVFIDDVDGRELSLDDVRTVTWSWCGVTYELDTSCANIIRIEAGDITLAALLKCSRKVGVPGTRKVPPSSARRVLAKSVAGVEAKEVRDWGVAEGFDVSDRGRIPRAVIAAYVAAHS